MHYGIYTTLVIVCTSVYVVFGQSPAEQIMQLRTAQTYADYHTYVAHEASIAQVYAENEKSYTRREGAIDAYLHVLPWVVWQMIAVLIACAAAVLLVLSWSYRSFGYLLLSVALIALLAWGIWRGYSVYAREEGVITDRDVPVYIGPDTTYPQRDTLGRLDAVDIEDRVDDWVKVRYTGASGWIQKAYIIQ